MESKVKNGSSWHGCKPKEAFKRCGMEDEYEDYNLACSFVHIRDWPFPAGLLQVDDKEFGLKQEFNQTLGRLANHLEDFIKYCPNTFSNEVMDIISELKKKLFKLSLNVMEKYPDIGAFIKIPNEE